MEPSKPPVKKHRRKAPFPKFNPQTQQKPPDWVPDVPPLKKSAPQSGRREIQLASKSNKPAAYYDGIVWVSRLALGELNVADHLQKLTFRPRQNRRFGGPKSKPVSYTVFDERPPDEPEADVCKIYGREKKAILYGPGAWLGFPSPYALSAFGIDFAKPLFKDCKVKLSSTVFHGELCKESPPQVQACNSVIKAFEALEIHGAARGILKFPCGFGKTVCAIWMILKFGYVGMVVIHNATLMHGFATNLKDFCPELNIGYIGSRPGYSDSAKFCEVHGADVILVSKSFLAKRLDLEDDGIYKDFDNDSFEAECISERWTILKTNNKLKRNCKHKDVEGPGWPGYRMKPKDKIPLRFLRRAGMAVFDEAHRVASEGTATLAMVIPCQRVLNLTATPFRGDGLDKELQYVCGPILYEASRSVEKACVTVRYWDSPNHRTLKMVDGTQMTARMVKKLCLDMEKNGDIVADVLESYTADKDLNEHGFVDALENVLPYQQLIFSERGKHCFLLKASIEAALKEKGLPLMSKPRVMAGANVSHLPKMVPTVSVLTGSVPPSDRPLTYFSPIIVTTYALSGDGLNIRTASWLLLATPMGSGKQEQRIGRIFRPCPHKPVPNIIHYIDMVGDFQDMGERCAKFYYSQKEWDVSRVDVGAHKNRFESLLKDEAVQKYYLQLKSSADEDKS